MKRLAAAALALTFVLAACSDDPTTDTTVPEAADDAEATLRAEADEIEDQAEEKEDELEERADEVEASLRAEVVD